MRIRVLILWFVSLTESNRNLRIVSQSSINTRQVHMLKALQRSQGSSSDFKRLLRVHVNPSQCVTKIPGIYVSMSQEPKNKTATKKNNMLAACPTTSSLCAGYVLAGGCSKRAGPAHTLFTELWLAEEHGLQPASATRAKHDGTPACTQGLAKEWV